MPDSYSISSNSSWIPAAALASVSGQPIFHEQSRQQPILDQKYVSVSAMPAYWNKSHEELRWEYYQQVAKAMPAYWNKSHEELRWEDYQQEDKALRRFSSSSKLELRPGFGSASFRMSAPSFDSETTCPTYINLQNRLSSFASEVGTASSATPSLGFTSKAGIPAATTATNIFGEPVFERQAIYAHGKLDGYCVSISAMPAYMNESHEELRWEHYKKVKLDGYCVSISAMPPYLDKCHEELRWEHYKKVKGFWTSKFWWTEEQQQRVYSLH